MGYYLDHYAVFLIPQIFTDEHIRQYTNGGTEHERPQGCEWYETMGIGGLVDMKRWKRDY